MENCPKCSKPLPAVGFFCGACLTQFKCKACKSILELDYMGCVNCGTPKENRTPEVDSAKNLNTFRLHETSTDRTIEATFSDIVGKDLAGILRDSYAIKQMNRMGGGMGQIEANIPPNVPNGSFEPIDVINNETENELEASSNQNNDDKIKQQRYPELIAIAMKNLPASETEWVVIYAFYASNYGKDIFTRQNIIERYEESNRSTTDRKNALSTYIKRAVQADYINPLASGYALLDKGVEKAKEIIGRTASSSPKVSKSKSKSDNKESEKDTTGKASKNKKVGGGPKRLSNLDLAPSGKESLEDFYQQWDAKNNNDNNLLFIYYLQEILKINAISHDHVYTCYDALELIIPTNFTVSINNTVTRKGWIQRTNGNLSVTTKGSNHLKTWKNTKK